MVVIITAWVPQKPPCRLEKLRVKVRLAHLHARLVFLVFVACLDSSRLTMFS
jgi:hypothetical protein